MAVVIQLNESSASSRCVPIFCVQSNGTSAATNESGRTFYWALGGVDYGAGGTLSAVSATMGMYMCNFSASKLSVVGQGYVYYGLPNSSATALQVCTPFQVVAYNSADSMRLGLFALPNAGANATNGLPTIGNDYGSTLTVGVSNLKAGTYSGVSVEVKTGGIQTASVGKGAYSGVSVEVTTGGIQAASVGAGNYSGMSVEIKLKGIATTSITSGTYSGFTVDGVNVLTTNADKTGYGVSTIAAGSYSGVTLQGLSNYANLPTVTVGTNNDKTGYGVTSIAAGSYSGVTIQGVSNYANLPSVTVGTNNDKTGYSVNSLVPGTYSGVSVEVTTGGIQATSLGAGTITAAKYAAGAIDSTAIATSGGQAIADRVLLRALASGSDTGRTVQDALRPMRNKVVVTGSVLTVYQEDDTTSAWTASVTTASIANPINSIDPA